jgi:ornithine carbamoyltransferase
MNHLLSLSDLSAGQLAELLLTARDLWRNPTGYDRACAGRRVALLDLGPALHLRLAIEVGFEELGGRIRTLTASDVGLRWAGRHADLARLIGASVDGLVLIAPADPAESIAATAQVPVLLAAGRDHSVLDALALLLTVARSRGALEGKRVALVGDGGELAHGLLLGGALAGLTVAVAHPRGFAPDPETVTTARGIAARNAGAVLITEDPVQAVTDADVIVIDPWLAPGTGRDPELRLEHFGGFALTAELLAAARPGALVLHPGPISAPEEVDAELLEGREPELREWASARVHVAKALLLQAFGRRT